MKPTTYANTVAEAHPATPVIIRHASGRRNLLKELSWYLYLLPTVGVLIFISYYPMIKTLLLSFYVSSNGSLEKFAGWFNYTHLLTDPNFYYAIYNTLYIGLFGLLLGLPLSFLLAALINRAMYGKSVLKVIYFLPNVTSAVAVVLVFKVLFFPDHSGTVNYVLSWLGIGPKEWVSDPSLIKWVVIFLALWQSTGFNILIWMAGLQSIPKDYYEAARVDGASRFDELLHITLPGVRPILWFLLITGVIGAFQRFDDVYTFGGASGSPLRSLQTIVLFFYEETMEKSQYGYGSAASIALFLMILLITVINLKISRRAER
ncbi:carbohydrate ABC transporter permease [Paenibacillus aestuarii]|uniref:Carbohydrate ABC transporter permease n=1 Tax=Paenibacillus aestuarii TaxID=516965 RepID=A0ABW0K6D8_9BACL|nr:sugar ABC transporter permease [Paenibacillus aestuarii]